MIQETLQQPCDRTRWTALLTEVFPNVSIYKTPQKSEAGAPEFVHDFTRLAKLFSDALVTTLYAQKKQAKVGAVP
jgi:hypothetical protein